MDNTRCPLVFGVWERKFKWDGLVLVEHCETWLCIFCAKSGVSRTRRVGHFGDQTVNVEAAGPVGSR